MHLKPFTYYRPKSLAHALELLQSSDPKKSMLMGGGTDILTKMKLRLARPVAVISLRGLTELRKIEQQGQEVFIGAACTLSEVKESNLVQHFFPIVAEAANRVGSPQLRNMGTIGGNVCLDTRCLYYNQLEWPGSLMPCFKRGGEKCHVVKKGARCYALYCADIPPTLLSLDAHLIIAKPSGEREIPIVDFYQDDGISCNCLKEEEVLVGIKVPIRQNTVSSYKRFSIRGAIDFPFVGVAISIERLSNGHYGNPRIAVTGLQSQPLRLRALELLLESSHAGEKEIEEVIEQGVRDIRIVRHYGISPSYRRNVLKVLIDDGLEECNIKGGRVK